MKALLQAFFLAAAIQFGCVAQDSHVRYQSSHKDSLLSYVDAITEKKIAKFKGPNQKQIREILEERKKDFQKNLADSTFVFDDRINAYLNQLLRRIYQSNPQLVTKDFYFFVDKSPIPNASCYGNGIFTVNLGLLNLIETDDELAFIFCHEIGHYLLEHNDESLLRYVATMGSKETKTRIRSIKKAEYGQFSAYRELMKDLSYNFLRRSRSDELQADSIGYRMYANTRFAKGAATSALKRLRESDSLMFASDSDVRRHFNFANYPFKEGWLKAEETLLDVKEKSDDYALDKDSVSTHPEIPARIARLHAIGAPDDPGAPTEALRQVKKRAAAITIQAFIDDSRVDMAIYLVMVLFNRGELDERAYAETMALLLKRTYEIKDNHTFGKYVPPLSPFSEERYLNEVRTFLHRLELKNVRKIGYEFCQKYSALMSGNASFSNTTLFFKNLTPP